jgi:hypothetical protein
MKVTNHFGVPETLVALANRDYYSKGKADYSVTEIISPPRIQRLRSKYYSEMETDVTDMMWSLLGSAIHVVAERSQVDGYINEERMFISLDNVVLSGAVDLQIINGDSVDIIDYKFTSIFAVRSDKKEWVEQLNIYGWMVAKLKGKKIGKLQICSFLRDWKAIEKNKADYPPSNIHMIDIPVWPLEKTEAFIRERIDAHRNAKVASDWEEELPLCSDEDRWIRETKYACHKQGKVRATKVFDNEAEAKDFAEKEGLYVHVRKGESIRCSRNYCGVNKWCSQYKKETQNAE